MQYDVSTPQAYLKALDNDWRKETLESLRSLILESDSNLQEFINYKMLAYGDKDNVVFHLNVQQNYVSLYVGNVNKIDESGELLKGLNVGKGCIRFSKSIKLKNTKISVFIDKTVQMWRSGKDLSC